MDEKKAKRVLQELQRRAEAIQAIDFSKLSFGAQRAFIEDESHLVAAVCGRQAGKTHGMALKLLRAASLNPHRVVLYIALSRPSAKRNLWPKLHELNRLLDLGAEFNHAELSMTLKNGATILLGGANDESEIERYRGATVPLIVLDEVQNFRGFLKRFVEEVLEPATIVLQGQICMIGTPNPMCFGYFHDACKGIEPGWATYHWTILDNPHVPHAKAWLEREVIGRRGVKVTDPAFRREWLGEWVRDTSGLVYCLEDRNLLDVLPDVHDWVTVLGMDVGYVDATAFVVEKYSISTGQSVVVHSHQRTGLIPSAIAVEVEKLNNEFDFASIVIDPGGGGKFIVEELKQRYAVPAKTAEKHAKIAAIELVNGDLRSGSLGILRNPNDDLIHDLRLLSWNYDRLEKVKGKHGGYQPKTHLEIDDRTPDHLADAFLYAHRECRQYLYDPELNPPKHGTKDWWDAQEKAMFDSIVKKNENPRAWWEA